MIIDCERCEVRGLACGNCAAPAIVTAAIASTRIATTAIVSQVREPGHPGRSARPGGATGAAWPDAAPQPDAEAPDLGPAELRALRALANAGLIAPLRYAPRVARAS
jgi:hypothetical protein